MLPLVTFPLHDKDGSFFKHIEKIKPDLKQIYSKAVVSITPPTIELQKARVETLSKDSFFELVFNAKDTLLGNPDLTIFGETALYLKGYLITKDVDWLSWEDPFILGKNPKTFKEERERNPQENEKRLSYVMPIIKLLLSSQEFL
jgi:hypothetical protein